MERKDDDKIRKILSITDRIFGLIPVQIPPEWFTSDLTVAQLRILLLLYMKGSLRMGTIASELDITLPTATGIVDNLVKKELVIREADEQDRRIVKCTLSSDGQVFINMIWVLGKSQMEKLLDGLSEEQLDKAREMADILLENAKNKMNETKES